VFDAFGFHPQGFPIRRKLTPANCPRRQRQRFSLPHDRHYHIMTANIGDKPIWLTEFGYLRDPPLIRDGVRRTPPMAISA
jgi:hypothetical protein